MPILLDEEYSRPTFVDKPDMRFATTFLSLNQRDFAVIGESLMDKTTGEIFHKRQDGRVVSFYQNKKYLDELCFHLKVLQTNNPEFVYDVDSTDGFFVSEDFDAMAMNKEDRLNILLNDQIIPNDESDSVGQMSFSLSTKTSGFFIRPTARDSDKAFIEFLCKEYNRLLMDYSGANTDCITERSKLRGTKRTFGYVTATDYDSILGESGVAEKTWEDSNCSMIYSVTCKKDSREEKIYTYATNLRINEFNCILLDSAKIANEFGEYDDIVVTIHAFRYDKIQFMYEHATDESLIDSAFKNMYANLIATDAKVHVDYYSTMYFIDDLYDLRFFGNEFIIGLVDVPYCLLAMNRLAALKNPGSIFVSKYRPNNADWVLNTLWAETIRDLREDGSSSYRDSETDLGRMETRFQTRITIGGLEEYPAAADNFELAPEGPSLANRAFVDKAVAGLNSSINRSLENIVITTEDNNLDSANTVVTDGGVVLEIKETSSSS